MAATAAADPLDTAMGKALFARNWVAAPASTDASDGLGPLFNARSCNACHAGGGPARFETDNGWLKARGLVVRSGASDGRPHPLLGAQLQTAALPGLAAEARVAVRLRGKALVVETRLQEPDDAIVLETRIAPSLRGRGAIDRIDETAILALADPFDRDGDGLSGRANMIADGADDWSRAASAARQQARTCCSRPLLRLRSTSACRRRLCPGHMATARRTRRTASRMRRGAAPSRRTRRSPPTWSG